MRAHIRKDMKHLNHKIFALLLLLLTGEMMAFAQSDKWTESSNYSESANFSGGQGTDSDPWQIATAADLARLAQQVNSGQTYSGNYFVQTADINLDAHSWDPIGRNASQYFCGSFDGQGYKISGMTISETYTSAYPVSGEKVAAPGYGLFGSLNGSRPQDHRTVVKNVVLVNPRITLDCAGLNKYTRVGLLAGSCGTNTELSNIHISGGQIDVQNTVSLTASVNYFIGGCVGDCAPGFAGSTDIAGYGVEFKNLYVGANITVTPKTAGESAYQYDLGGITGRLRYSHKPLQNCYFEGNIKAEQFLVSPSVAAVRNTSAGANQTSANYNGIYKEVSEEQHTTYFGNYQIWYNGEYRTIQADEDGALVYDLATSKQYLQSTTEGKRKFWSFHPCGSGHQTRNLYQVQGVNNGSQYAPTISQDHLATYNNGILGDNPGYRWYLSGSQLYLDRYAISLAKVGNQVVATLQTNGDGELWKYHWTRNGASLTSQTMNGVEDISVDRWGIPEYLFEDFTWTVYATCEKDGRTYTTNTAEITIPHNPEHLKPTLTFTQDESQLADHGKVTLMAALQNEAKWDNVQYVWYRDDAEIADHYKEHEVTQMLKATRWKVKANYSYEGYHYVTALSEEYTVPGNALPYNVSPTLSETRTRDGVRYTITPMLNGEPVTQESIEANGYTVQYDWFYGNPGDATAELPMTQDRVVGFLHEGNIHLYSTLAQNMPVAARVSYYYGEELAAGPFTITNVAAETKATIPVAAEGSIVAKIEGANGRYHAAFEGLYQLGAESTDYTVQYQWTGGGTDPSTDPHFVPTDMKKDIHLTVMITKDGATRTLTDDLLKENRNVVYIQYSNAANTYTGNDANSGQSVDKPVKTWAKAYAVLKSLGADTKSIEQNIIVVEDVNIQTGAENVVCILDTDTQNGIKATITGVWPWKVSESDPEVGSEVNGGKFYVASDKVDNARIGADTRFKDIVFYGNGNKNNTSRLCCYFHDVILDEGCVMQNMRQLETQYGATEGRYSVDFDLLLSGNSDASNYQDCAMPQWYKDRKKPMNVVIRSGRIGRILTSRQTGKLYTYDTKAILGSPQYPFMTRILVDIADGNPQAKNADGSIVNNGNGCTDDIAVISAGTTQGTTWGDCEMNLRRGMIASVVAGSQGNGVTMNGEPYPVNSYFGRTVVNIRPEKKDAEDDPNDNVIIQNYYGGGMGRSAGSVENVCNMFFYGKAELNMYGGTIQNNIYGAGAGGTSGLSPQTHDTAIPYTTNDGSSVTPNVEYVAYDADKTMPTVKSYMLGEEDVDISTTMSRIDISGGIVNGSVYGGGWGYSPNGINVKYAPQNCGVLFGTTFVNISGGTISGSVYGGGRGSSELYTLAINHSEQEVKARANDFLVVGQVYGNTNVHVTGGVIDGSVYGGGEGVISPAATPQLYTDIAKVTGNPLVVINNPKWNTTNPYYGNVYGGGAHGTVVGNPVIEMKDGDIFGCLYGGGAGVSATQIGQTSYRWYKEDESVAADNTKNVIGMVQGNTHVIITGGHIRNSDNNNYNGKPDMRGRIYGGGAYATVVGNTKVELKASFSEGLVTRGGRIDGNIFGGGQGEVVKDGSGNVTSITSADVTGNTDVLIAGGDFESKYHEGWDITKGETPFYYYNNTYGGGNIACTVGGNTQFDITHGMFGKDDIFDPLKPDTYNKGWQEAYDTEGSPCFAIFGAGYGLHTRVLGSVYMDIDIPYETTKKLTGSADEFVPYQSYMEAVGGGFNGSVKGKTNVHTGGNAVLRNVYGGGYYGPVSGGTNVIITGGNIDEVYGGGLMGSVPGDAKVTIGMKAGATIESHSGNPYTYRSEGYNQNIYVQRAVYGGNDVSGRVNTATVEINGGKIFGNVYGAGNGNHKGYYEPGHCAYIFGENDGNYFLVDHSAEGGPKGITYTGRPQTGQVTMYIGGDVKDGEGHVTSTRDSGDKAFIYGQLFGGGNSCTIGDWDEDLKDEKYEGNPHLVRDDPDYFLGGGNLTVNIGSHAKIGRTHAEIKAAGDAAMAEYLNEEGENVSGLFMGCSGKYLATQTTAMDDYFYHHYYDSYTKKYWPGFAVFADNGDPLSREEGLKSFNAYLNNILIWSDHVQLNIDNNAEDVWMSNFVGGGFRGSMKAKTDAGKFSYSLPRGVTIGHDVVGGAYNTDVVYRVFDTTNDMHNYTVTDGHYNYCTTIKPGWQEGRDYHHVERDAEGNITGIVRFYYDGGMLSHDNSGDRRKGVFKAYPSTDDNVVDFSGYTSEQGLRKYKNKALVYVDARCQMEPEIIDEHVHGGNIFGGCFESGTVDGDIWTDYRCYIAPSWYGNDNFNGSQKMFDNAADYQNNFAMLAFGAGFGKNTSIKGDVYLRVIYNRENGTATYPCLYNALGGSYQGSVDGNTNVYYNAGMQGMLVGGIYGGGSQGYVAGKSFVELAGGYVANVYGGAREANVGKGTHVWAYDGALRNWGDDLTGVHDDAPLVIERMFGGSDVSGLIGFKADATDVSDDKGRVAEAGWTAYYSTSNWPEELFNNGVDEREGLKKFDSYIQVGGTDHSTRGFPLIGQIYAGGNGENTDTEHGHILPGIDTALIELSDGNVIEAFGGGNAATVHKQNYILTNGQNDPVNVITVPNSHLAQIMKQRILNHAPDCYTLNGNTFTLKKFNVQRLFGGNNLAEMDIQPKWMLKSGHINSVYSGGNMGRMTYYNPSGVATTAGNANTNPRGLCITIDQTNINIENLYGGCRLAAVQAKTTGDPASGDSKDGNGNVTFGTGDFYGATVNVIAGHVGNVYGGNDVSGYVYNGTNVNITGSITGNVYGAGNGDYRYKLDPEKQVDEVTEEWVPSLNGGKGAQLYTLGPNSEFTGIEGITVTPMQKLLAINAYRPHVAKAYLNIGGTESNKVYIHGSVYCGGNASTIHPIGNVQDATVKFNVGDYAVINEVFMGSNGVTMKGENYMKDFETVNEIDLTQSLTWQNVITSEKARTSGAAGKTVVAMADRDLTDENNTGEGKIDWRPRIYPHLLSLYMRAVDMQAMPVGFDMGEKTFTETYIGTYCMGGNAGTMLVDSRVNITFPKSLVMFGRIIGGCKDARFAHWRDRSVYHDGGFRMPLSDKIDGQPNTVKLNMTIQNQWQNKVMRADNEGNYQLYDNTTNNGEHWTQGGREWLDGCNVYGGCYQSGDFMGDVIINVESDMMKYNNNAAFDDTRLDLSNKRHQPVFNVYGAGYGPESRTYGNTHIYMKDIPVEARDASPSYHPSVNNIYGGGRNGMLIGNTVVHVHDGLVYGDVVGGCFAANLYGSSQVTVGYPKFYVCKMSGEYSLDRGDKWNTERKTIGSNGGEADVIKQSVKYLKGDYVPCNVYDMINGFTPIGSDSHSSEPFLARNNREKDTEYFSFTNEATDATLFPGGAGSWDNVDIQIRGGVYGGGFSLDNSTSATAGSYTTLKLLAGHDTQYNFDSRPDLAEELEGGKTTAGYGGNASIIVTDNVGGAKDHIRISTILEKQVTSPQSTMGLFTKETVAGVTKYTHHGEGKPDSETTYYALSGDGGVFGDGHLVFCEGFRAADITGYGWDGATVKYPAMINTFQRMDLLSVNDCCLMLQGAQDFATDAVDATIYSIARINELRMNSSLNAAATLGEITSGATGVGTNEDVIRQRNYIGFFNNVHYLGAIVSNDAFSSAFHGTDGEATASTYHDTKQQYITAYDGASTPKTPEAVNAFRQRNQGTARNAIGINNGYCLRIQNQEYRNGVAQTYYGPIVGVVEAKLLTLTQDEGGGYVYADNVHEEKRGDGKETFLNTSGNFVFPGLIKSSVDPTNNQYIVDDCFSTHYGSPENLTDYVNGAKDEGHYWYVEGNKYYYNSTLTGYTFKDAQTFNLISNDPNVLLAGVTDRASLKVESVTWENNHRPDYASSLMGATTDKYQFDFEVGGAESWTDNMPTVTTTEGFTAKSYKGTAVPVFNIRLQDKQDNSGEEAYDNHLDEPENVKIVLTSDGKTYTVNLKIIYLQGPSYNGFVSINNCALPGERVGFSSDGIHINTSEQMPVVSYGWKLIPYAGKNSEDKDTWDETRSVEIPESQYTIQPDGSVEGWIPALYKHNKWAVAYTFNAGGHEFTVYPDQDAELPYNRMVVVHNYHKMADVIDPSNGDMTLHALDPQAGANIYIADDSDLAAFARWINDGHPTEGLHFFLQNNLTLPAGWALGNPFRGTLHGNGYVLSLPDAEPMTVTSLFGENFDPATGRVYNLGVPNATITTVPDASPSGIINSFTSADGENLRYGKTAYQLSHYFTSADDKDGYVAALYANNDGMGGDWRYALTTAQSYGAHAYLRTGTPNWNSTDTRHDMVNHAEDYTVTEHDCLFFGQALNPTGIAATPYPQHIDDTYTDGVLHEANRVYRTAGYYRSTTPDAFHYNKEAWALQPTLTAIDFAAANEESSAEGSYNGRTDDRPAALTSFNSNSNATIADADKVTRNLLVYHNEAAAVIPDEANKTLETSIYYHGIRKSGEPATASTPYFHLVDKQDYCAPIAFTVNSRAWYERQPNLLAQSDNSAWEGICLPFTAKKVTASTNGEITHFYGEPTEAQLAAPATNDKSLHHEYWLRGLVSVSSAGEYALATVPEAPASGPVATFQRPGTDSEAGLFQTADQTAAAFDYTYAANDSLTSRDGYNSTDNPWYTTEHTFTAYKPLTANTPYIVSFPGERYYEFDLTGQTVTFSTEGEVSIPVTPESMTTAANRYTHGGTFLARTGDYVINSDGNAFESADEAATLPFRTYMQVPAAEAKSLVLIGAHAASKDQIAVQPVAQQGDDGGDGTAVMSPDYLRIYPQGRSIVVVSGSERLLPCHGIGGSSLGLWQIHRGTNTFRNLHTGIYVVGGTKVVVR